MVQRKDFRKELLTYKLLEVVFMPLSEAMKLLQPSEQTFSGEFRADSCDAVFSK
jgi:hypothetical protein